MAKVELSEDAKRARADYLRDWRRRNRDKVKQYEANHWENVAKKAAQRDADDRADE